jgi:GMP synthase-like glutamine amidotransferase
VWAVIEHADYESAGAVPAALEAAGCRWSSVRRSLGQELPDHRGLDGLIVLGGPGASADDDSVAQLVEERTLIADAVRADLPVLGICLGAQLLAVALGGAVMAAPAPEIGMRTVRLTDAGAADPVLGPLGSPLSVLQWHHETFSLPPGGVGLASSDACTNQAFRWADRVYGLQFHVEIDPALAERIQPELEPVHLDAEALNQASRTGRSVLDRFLRLTWHHPE